MLKAVTRQANAVDAKIRELNARRDGGSHPISTAYFFDHYATPDDVAVMVTESDFLEARNELVPSVSAGELAHYEKVRATFEGGRDKEPSISAAAAPATTARPRIGVPGVAGRRTTSSSSKGKGKGKGKAVARESDDEEDDVSDTPSGYVNGRTKGKGKAVAPPVFEDGTGGDEGLYD
jgi:peroxin-6